MQTSVVKGKNPSLLHLSESPQGLFGGVEPVPGVLILKHLHGVALPQQMGQIQTTPEE